MALQEEERAFVKSLLDYYIAESGSYVQMAGEYAEGGAVRDVAFGIIVGCVYSGFMESRRGEGGGPGLDDMGELRSMIGGRAGQIREAVGGAG
ncbi:MAG: hypothetical protein MPI95_05360 [Nitrosopumilus sp.]|nr:hypothetical protein [Nitrosopumilus sp.]CAI9831172.1 conserved hypothetical protein [Nitrosopumilaceae archaeon]MDA7945233.1 hypothetical protein [Nitrosopumilus sp.]MDA7954982.1 hypothetical protein [Nitrosopumilus sp.]MDA7958498.1 hypothetical protein [Nitrosopumilus sp.]